MLGQHGQQGNHRCTIGDEFLHCQPCVLLAGLLIGQGAVSQKHDIYLPKCSQAIGQHRRVRREVRDVHLIGVYVSGTAGPEVGGITRELVRIARDQEKIAALRSPAPGAGMGNG